MSRRARLAFLAMMVAETVILSLLLMALWRGLVDAGWDLRLLGSGPLMPHAEFDFAGRGFLLGVVLGAALLWIAIFAFPKEAWPHSKGLRIGLLVSFLPALPSFILGALEDRIPPAVVLRAFASLSWLALVTWVLVHPVGLAGESWRRGRRVLCIGWACVALAPCLAAILAPASLWVSGLVLLAVRFGLGVATPFAWGPAVPVGAVARRRPTRMDLDRRASTCLLAMVVAETLLLLIPSLDPWSEGIESERTFARLAGKPFPPNAVYDFVERFGFAGMALATWLLWVAIAAFPKEGWLYGKSMRTGLLVGLLPALALMSAEPFVHVEDIGGPISAVWNAATVLSMLTLFAWLVVHPLHLAKEATRRGQGVLSSAWTTVGLALSLFLLLCLVGFDFPATFVLSAALAFLALRLGLGAATALAWRSSSSLRGAS